MCSPSYIPDTECHVYWGGGEGGPRASGMPLSQTVAFSFISLHSAIDHGTLVPGWVDLRIEQCILTKSASTEWTNGFKGPCKETADGDNANRENTSKRQEK